MRRMEAIWTNYSNIFNEIITDFAAEFVLLRETNKALSFCLSYFSGSDRISQYPKRFPPLRSIRPADFNTSIFLCRALRDKPSLSESTDWEMVGSSLSSSNSLSAKASSKASFWAGLWRFGLIYQGALQSGETDTQAVSPQLIRRLFCCPKLSASAANQ